MSCLAMLSGERFCDQRSKAAQRSPRAPEHQPVIQTVTVPVIVRRSAFSCVFLRSAETHDSLFFAGNSPSLVGSGGERSIQLGYAS